MWTGEGARCISYGDLMTGSGISSRGVETIVLSRLRPVALLCHFRFGVLDASRQRCNADPSLHRGFGQTHAHALQRRAKHYRVSSNCRF